MKKIVKIIGATAVVAILVLNVFISSSNNGSGKFTLTSLADLKAANAECIEPDYWQGQDWTPYHGHCLTSGFCSINEDYFECDKAYE